MGLLKQVEPGGAYLKVGIFGLAGSGKTLTATKMAIGTRAHKPFKLTGPIAYFDTERGTPYVEDLVFAQTGTHLLAAQSRALSDLKTFMKECVERGVSVAIVDSMTHVWERLKEDYLSEINVVRRQNRLSSLEGLEFQHWAAIKSQALWGGWTDLLLNSPLHIIVCGRVGNIYEYEEDEKGKRKLVTTGVKMKAEGDFGYEPSLVVEMEARQAMNNGDVQRIDNYALVLKDRFNVINGSTLGPFNDKAPNAVDTFTAFLPHIERLRPAGHDPIDTARRTPCNVDAEGQGEWQRERKAREIAMEELEAEFAKAGMTGSVAKDVAARKVKLLEECFGTASGTKLMTMKSDALREGLAKVRVRMAEIKENANVPQAG